MITQVSVINVDSTVRHGGLWTEEHIKFNAFTILITPCRFWISHFTQRQLRATQATSRYLR